ncbi:MAG: hypothetical protein HZC41_04115 [Chloroflexi bacterium]|nr:hypothetical protein [Chloroflexota bacterium]
MNTTTALKIAASVAQLTGLCTTFQAKFGRRYQFTPDSPAEAYELHRAICAKQAEIAELLDDAALENPMKKASEWWRWQNTMDMATAGELAREVNHLIASCAYFEASPCASGHSPTITAAQEAIAGMLHPEVRARVPVALR